MDTEHKQRLQKLWLKLLENISDYTGIIDGLYSERILTPALKETVIQKKGKDRLREILDILPRRGDRAFSVFYQVLVSCGEDTAADLLCPELADQRRANALQSPALSGVKESSQAVGPMPPDDDELPAKWPDHKSHDPFRVELTKVLEENVGMKALYNKAVAGTGSVYGMHKSTRGIFLIISNEFFKEARANGEDLNDRDGTGKDTIALKALFEQLHFRVVVKVNLTAEEMLDTVRARADEVEPTDNCFACAVLTHGERDKVYGVDGKTLALDALKAAVTDNCQMLIGKPKIFFIQACQGKKFDGSTPVVAGQGDAPSKATNENEDFQEMAEKFTGITLRDKTESDVSSEGRASSKSDIFVAVATVPDFVSWRNTNWGTWFVQAVVYIFSRYAHRYEINQLMVRVNKLVSTAETSKGYKQVSVYSSALTSELYFFPGLYESAMVESHSEVDFKKDVPLAKGLPLQTATEEPRRVPSLPRPASESGSLTAHPTDGVDGGISRLVE